MLPSLERFLTAEEVPHFEAACQTFPRRSIRLRDDRINRPLPFDTSPIEWYSNGRWVDDSAIRPASFLNYAIGDYYIQDAGSLLPIAVLEPRPGEWICDLCASPGGKASAILEAMRGEGCLVANESIRTRVHALEHVLGRTGQANYVVTSWDPDEMASRLPEFFDAILVDAPCSGQMLVGKSKRDENAWHPSQISHCAQRQTRILNAAIRMLKPNGRLVYSTCTFAEVENEAQIRRLLQEYPAVFEPIRQVPLEKWTSPVAGGCYRLWPHRDSCAGGFAAGLRRTDHNLGISSEFKSDHTLPKKIYRGHAKEERIARDALREFGELSGAISPRLWCNQVHIATSEVWSFLDRYPWLGKPCLGMVHEKQRWLPTQSLSLLREDLFTPRMAFDLDETLARQYVRGESIRPENTLSGWLVAQWEGFPLGWAKATHNRWNNHLPPWCKQ